MAHALASPVPQSLTHTYTLPRAFSLALSPTPRTAFFFLQTKAFAYFYLGQVAVLLFKSG